MTLTSAPVREQRHHGDPPEEAPAVTPGPAVASTRTGLLSAGELVALAVAAGSEDPDVAAERVYAAAAGSRDRLSAAASVLIQRLKTRSDDLEATLALRIVERALVRAPYPDGPWRWAHNLSPRRIRAAERRRRRALRRRGIGPRLPARARWRSAWRRTPPAPH